MNKTEIITQILIVVVMAASLSCFIYIMMKSNRQVEDAITRWAQDNGFRFVKVMWRRTGGPFKAKSWFQLSGDGYYKFVVADKEGKRQIGRASCRERV